MIWGPTAAALSHFQFIFDGFNSHIIGPFVKNSLCVVTKTKVDEDGNMVFFHRETLIGLS